MSDEKKLKVGIIGVGTIGSAHAAAIYLGEIPNMRLVALCDISSEKIASLKEKYGDVPAFTSHTELINSGLCDAVIISTPHYFHPPIAIDAFRAGLNVLTEKPAGVDCASVKQMIAAARDSGKAFGVMFNQRSNKLFSKAQELVASGELGELKRAVWIITNWYRKQAYYDSGDWRATWSGEGGGVLINQAPHNLDLWQWICGMPSAIRAECYVSKFHDIEVEDDATLFAEYENGATAVFITSTGDYPGTNRFEITGTAGKIVLEGGKLTFYKLSVDEREYRLSPNEFKNSVTVTEFTDEKVKGHHVILENFAASVLDGVPLIASGEEALCELELSNAAYLSAWQNKKITLPVNDAEFVALLEEKKKNSVEKSARKEAEIPHAYVNRWNTNW